MVKGVHPDEDDTGMNVFPGDASFILDGDHDDHNGVHGDIAGGSSNGSNGGNGGNGGSGGSSSKTGDVGVGSTRWVVPGFETSKDLSVTAVAVRHTVPTVSYVVQEKDNRGNLDPDVILPGFTSTLVERITSPENQAFCRKRGLHNALALMRDLKMGLPVELVDGTVHAEDVLSGPRRGRKLVLMGDTCDPSGAADLIAGADVLVHEATNAYIEELDDRDDAPLPMSSVSTAPFLAAEDAEAEELSAWTAQQAAARAARAARTALARLQTSRKAVMHGHSTPDMAGTFARDCDVGTLVMTHFSARIRGRSEAFPRLTTTEDRGNDNGNNYNKDDDDEVEGDAENDEEEEDTAAENSDGAQQAMDKRAYNEGKRLRIVGDIVRQAADAFGSHRVHAAEDLWCLEIPAVPVSPIIRGGGNVGGGGGGVDGGLVGAVCDAVGDVADVADVDERRKNSSAHAPSAKTLLQRQRRKKERSDKKRDLTADRAEKMAEAAMARAETEAGNASVHAHCVDQAALLRTVSATPGAAHVAARESRARLHRNWQSMGDE